jgi:hypothetical protein
MASDTVRIKQETHLKLKRLAKSFGVPMIEALDHAVEALRRQYVLEQTNRAFLALRDNPRAWQAELAERELWDATLADDVSECD